MENLLKNKNPIARLSATNIMKQLFQYAVILHERDKEGTYVDSKIIIEPTTVLGKSEKDLLFKITREIPEEYVTNPENVQIVIRNF
jgi:hypothetical protein